MASSTWSSFGAGKPTWSGHLREWWGHAAGAAGLWTRLSLPGALLAGWLSRDRGPAAWLLPALVGPLAAGLYALAYQLLRARRPLPLYRLRAVDTVLLGAAALSSALLLHLGAGGPAPLLLPAGLLWALAWGLNWNPAWRQSEERRSPGAAGDLRGAPRFRSPAAGPVTAGFRSYDPTHAGLDIGLSRGTPVLAPAGGQVVQAGPSHQWGYAVVLEHGGGWTSLLAHLERTLVRVPQQVRSGEVVGLSGSSGISTGPHLHLEIRHNGTPIDPAPLLTRHDS